MINKNPLFPVFLKLAQLNTLIVGGGHVALEKCTAILQNAPQANLKIVAPEINPSLSALLDGKENIQVIKRKFQDDDIIGMDLILCSTDDPQLHRHIHSIAYKSNILINVADTPELCDFYMASIVQKGNLKIGISTNGQSPTAAKRIKELLQEAIPEEIDDLIDQLHDIREKLKGDFKFKVYRMMEITKDLGGK